MVRQAYVNRLVLGRSAFDPPNLDDQEAAEPTPAHVPEANYYSLPLGYSSHYAQRYNSRGYPDNRESRRLSRRSRHAQNDILTTIGVCVSVDEQEGGAPESRAPKTLAEREQARVVIEEHWYGSLLGSITEISGEASTLWIKYLRRRIQVFQVYGAVPLTSIIRTDWMYATKLSFFGAGLIPDICFHGLKGFVEGIWEAIEEYISPETLRQVLRYLPFDASSLVNAGRFLFKISVRSTRIALEILLDNFVMLQKLQLVKSWPPVSRRMLSVVLKLGPSMPSVWNAASIITFARASMTSPYMLCLVYNLAEESLREKLFAYMQTLALRPDNPDATSFRLELDDDRVELSEATVLRLPVYQRSITEQLLVDYRSLRHSVLGVTRRIRETFEYRFPLSLLRRSADPVGNQRPVSRPSTSRGRMPDAMPAVSFAADNQTVVRPGGEEGEEHEPIPRRGPPSPDPNITPPQSPGGSSSGLLSEADPSAVQVRTRSGSTSTLHMDLEVQLPVNSQGVQERRHNSFTTSEQNSFPVKKLHDLSSDHCRVTQLTVHSSTTLSVQLALVLSSAVLVPLEGIYLRSVARSFLAAQGTSTSQINKFVYPTMQFGLCGRDWKGIMVYSGQVLLCFGVETAIRLYFWRICGNVSLWWGRSKFGWGHL